MSRAEQSCVKALESFRQFKETSRVAFLVTALKNLGDAVSKQPLKVNCYDIAAVIENPRIHTLGTFSKQARIWTNRSAPENLKKGLLELISSVEAESGRIDSFERASEHYRDFKKTGEVSSLARALKFFGEAFPNNQRKDLFYEASEALATSRPLHPFTFNQIKGPLKILAVSLTPPRYSRVMSEMLSAVVKEGYRRE